MLRLLLDSFEHLDIVAVVTMQVADLKIVVVGITYSLFDYHCYEICSFEHF